MRRKNLWTIVFGIVLILVGFLALLDSLEFISFWSALGKLWPLILIALGVWLLLKKRYFSWDEKVEIKEGNKYSKAFGDLKIDAAGMDPHGMDVEMGFGDLDVNLTKATLSDQENVVHLALGFGDIRVWIPSEVKASITAGCGAGDIDVLGKTVDGLGKSMDHCDEGYDSIQKKLRIRVKAGFGDIKVSRV
ncbi:MAG: cell wall-active antibiotics response protein [Candidatus Zixiibacteriota bacterium]|nr:MAG: cell wall-active antibiotics response protein [candidate division Zixibacteria bacterium]